MPKRTRTVIAVAVIVIFGAFGIWSLVGTATPYVGFAEARAMNSQVQVMGKIEFETADYNAGTGIFSFDIINEQGDRMRVDFAGIKPGNFEQAESVVCVGRYKGGVFVAKDLLVKCPSKYQGQEVKDKVKDWGKGA